MSFLFSNYYQSFTWILLCLFLWGFLSIYECKSNEVCYNKLIVPLIIVSQVCIMIAPMAEIEFESKSYCYMFSSTIYLLAFMLHQKSRCFISDIRKVHIAVIASFCLIGIIDFLPHSGFFPFTLNNRHEGFFRVAVTFIICILMGRYFDKNSSAMINDWVCIKTGNMEVVGKLEALGISQFILNCNSKPPKGTTAKVIKAKNIGLTQTHSERKREQTIQQNDVAKRTTFPFLPRIILEMMDFMRYVVFSDIKNGDLVIYIAPDGNEKIEGHIYNVDPDNFKIVRADGAEFTYPLSHLKFVTKVNN